MSYSADYAKSLEIQLADANRQLAEARASATAMHDIGMDVVRERDDLRARLEAVRALCDEWAELLRTCSEIMTTPQRNAWKDALVELTAALSAAPQHEPDDESMLNAGGRTPEAFVFEPKRPRQPEPPASDEPARCEHDWDTMQPATTCRRCGTEYHVGRWVNCPDNQQNKEK